MLISGVVTVAKTPNQLAVVLEQVLPDELTSRADQGAGDLCARLATQLASVQPGGADSTRTAPEDIFRRLARG